MKRRLLADALRQLEAEHAAIESERPVDIGDFEMHVTDADSGIDRRIAHQLALAVTLRVSGATRKAVIRLRDLRRTWKRKP